MKPMLPPDPAARSTFHRFLHSRRQWVRASLAALVSLAAGCVTSRPAGAAAAPKSLPMSRRQKKLQMLWEEHIRHEFATHDTEETLKTMVDDAYVNHIPTLTGGVGKDELRAFYGKRFIPQMPPDTAMTAVSRTIGTDQLVDEMVFKFTHTIRMDWMLPGVEPTGKRVEVPLVAIVKFRDGKLAHEHIYWDQASVLVQLGLIDASTLPVAGVESARKVLDPSLPSNDLMHRASSPR